jgi:hypothetical protein
VASPTRERIHQLIDQLSERELATAERLLSEPHEAHDPVLRALANAPLDDEPLTPEEEAALEEGYADFAAGRMVTDDDLWRRLDDAAER